MKNYLNDMNKKLTFQYLEDIENQDGSRTQLWKDKTTLWGSITPLNGKINPEYGKLNTTITHLIIIRFNKNINANQRILFNNRYFYINFILNIEEKNKFLEIYCEEK